MNGSRAVDPLEALRRADPVDAGDLPSASLARVRASVMGELDRDIHDVPTSPRRAARPSRTLRRAGLAGLAAAIAVSLAVIRGIDPGTAPDPSGGQDPSRGPDIGLCVESYSLETLANRTLAFDGTVVAVEGDIVTFRVETAFRGAGSNEVTVTASGMTGGAISPGTGPTTLVPGKRYLVAGDAGFAWACGFTQPYDPTIAAQWSERLRR